MKFSLCSQDEFEDLMGKKYFSFYFEEKDDDNIKTDVL